MSDITSRYLQIMGLHAIFIFFILFGIFQFSYNEYELFL